MSMPDPFGFIAQCAGEAIDTQLMTDTFTNIINTTFTFRCCGLSCTDQPGPTFKPCVNDALTFCIGGLSEQHACAGVPTSSFGHCQQISKAATGASVSPQCPQQLVDYMKVQPVGVQSACCDSATCVVGEAYACSGARALQMCVGDGAGVECINPVSLSICAGSFTSAAGGGERTGGVQSTTSGSGTTGAQVPNATQSPPSSPTTGSSKSGLGPSDIATIVGSTLGVITSLVGVWVAYKQIKKRRKRRQKTEAPGEEIADRRLDDDAVSSVPTSELRRSG